MILCRSGGYALTPVHCLGVEYWVLKKSVLIGIKCNYKWVLIGIKCNYKTVLIGIKCNYKTVLIGIKCNYKMSIDRNFYVIINEYW